MLFRWICVPDGCLWNGVGVESVEYGCSVWSLRVYHQRQWEEDHCHGTFPLFALLTALNLSREGLLIFVNQIVDECPGGCAGTTFDLFPTAFSSLALPSAGEIPITWDYITCQITTPFKLRTKTGSSQYWFAIQVYNANQAITKLEVSSDSGSTWKSCVRQTYNYWLLASGTGSATVWVRVTAKGGKVVTTKKVPTAEEQTVTATSNFV